MKIPSVLRQPRFHLLIPALACLAITAVVYWSVRHASFVWDDELFLHNSSAIRYGDAWMHVMFKAILDSTNYFRPLGMAFFAIQARVFDVNPGPMHLVSLALHLLNVALVGVLTAQVTSRLAKSHVSAVLLAIVMLLYGLHPLLIEAVAWIACQFELLATGFMLLGMLCHLRLRQGTMRNIAVSTCFFAAAMSKESAVAFPLLLITFDWLLPVPATETDVESRHPRSRIRQLWIEYICVLAAGVLYLVLRGKGLAGVVHDTSALPMFSWERLQLVCNAYVTYWKVSLWPMVGLGPLHVATAGQFASTTWESLAIDALAIAIVAFGAAMWLRRKPIGALIAAFTVALLPVLHIVPVTFDDSVYHDRWAMTPLAFACSFIPSVIARINWRFTSRRLAQIVVYPVIVAWLLLAIVNIRVTLPLWANDQQLWRWAVRMNPTSTLAQNNLLSAYLANDDLANAASLVKEMLADPEPCANCMLNIASFSIQEGNAHDAELALERAGRDMRSHPAKGNRIPQFIVLTGDLRRMKHDLPGAIAAYRDAIKLDPALPEAYPHLAVALIDNGQLDQARRIGNTALPRLAPDRRSAWRKSLDKALTVAREQRPTSSSTP